MSRLGGAVRVVHREFSTLTRLSLGGLVGGGVVAGIISASKALGDMARQGQQLRYQAEALGTTPEFLERYTDGLNALGVDAATASRDVQNVISTLRDAETYGSKSQLYQALEKGVHGSGKRLWREVQQQMAGPEGAEGAFKFLIGRMQNMAPSGQAAMLKALNISSLAFKDLKEILPQLPKRVQLSREETERLSVANAKIQIEMSNVGRILGSAVMPGIEKVTTAFAKFLQSQNGKKFAEELRQWSDSVGTAIADWMKDEGPDGLKANIESLKQGIAELKGYFDAADQVIKGMGGSWTDVFKGLVATGFLLWVTGVAAQLALIARIPGIATLLAGLAGAAWFLNKNMADQIADPEARKKAQESGAPQTWFQYFKEFIDDIRNGNIDLLGTQQPPVQQQKGEGLPKTEPERRADIENENQERSALLTEMKDLTGSFAQINEYFAIGGPEGSADGRSGYGAGVGGGFDIASMLGPAGGGPKRRPLPRLPPWATALSAIPGTVRPAQSAGVGFASWYGNRPDLGFKDTEDRGRKGVSEREQGIALGPTGTLGQYHYLTDPHSGLTHVTRQTDTGPNIRTQKLVDIHASQLARMGYTAKSFPSGRGLWGVQPAGFGQPGQQAAWAGRGGAFDEDDSGSALAAFARGGENPITASLADEDGGRAGGGSATVDIDIGGLNQPARNPAELFRPQPLEGAVQMQNATHVQHNPLSFQ